MGGIARVLFPMLALFMVNIGQAVLRATDHHTSALRLAATLLMAMAAIRLTVYAIRYIFAPSGWLRTTEGFVVGFTWGMVALHLTGLLPEVTTFLDELSFSAGQRKFSVLLLIQSVLIAVITLLMTLWAGRVLENRLMQTEQLDMNLRVVLSKLLRVALILVGVLSALSVVGFDITVLSVFGGALGVGLGFGLQKIASNYISGFIILLDHSIHLGDVLTVDGHYGVAHQLRARYLVLRKLDGTEVVIPNDTLITSTVINHSYSDRKILVRIPVQISYDSPLEKAMDIIRQAALTHGRVLVDPEPRVLVAGFGENGVDLQLSCWVNDPEEGFALLQSEIYLKILEGFRSAGIAIPFPQREVRVLK
jgi:small-conductance mechanosensitive channel